MRICGLGRGLWGPGSERYGATQQSCTLARQMQSF